MGPQPLWGAGRRPLVLCSLSHQCRSSGSSSCAPRPAVGAAEQLRPGPAPRCTHKPTAAWAGPAPAREPLLSTRVPCRRRVDRARDRPMAQPRLRRRGPCWCPSSAPGACGGGAVLGSVEAAGAHPALHTLLHIGALLLQRPGRLPRHPSCSGATLQPLRLFTQPTVVLSQACPA